MAGTNGKGSVSHMLASVLQQAGYRTGLYTKEAETADMFIERVTHEIGRNRRVRVATSDGMEQIIILGHGALRVSARMFHEEVQNVEKQIRALVQGEA